MVVILDNYDSFTYNLDQAFLALGVRTSVFRNDRLTPALLRELKPSALVLSPGPGRPENAGRMPEIVARVLGEVPILGVCLGLQMLAVHYGGQLRPAASLVHGKSSSVFHDSRTLFNGLPNPLAAGRYHSLAVACESLPDCLEISARTADGEIMGLRHRQLLAEGVQFHPESILTPLGNRILANFLSQTTESTPAVQALINGILPCAGETPYVGDYET